MKFKALKSDAVFKNVFFRNVDLLRWLIDRTMKYYDKDMVINNLVIRNCELTKNKLYIKNKIVDMLLDSNNYMFNVELNGRFDKSRMIRNYLYQCSYVTSLIPVSGKYSVDIKPIIQINYNFKQNKTSKLINKYVQLEETTYEEYLNLIYTINIYIDRMLDKWYNMNRKRIL